jgi:hypothetical protein
MSTRTANLPIERSYLLKAWLVVAAIVIVAATFIAFGLGQTSDAARNSKLPSVTQVKDYGPARPAHLPMVIDGVVCGQCR